MDDLKPVHCGCGGEANWDCLDGKHQVGCLDCGICTKSYGTEAEAVAAWNRAMGADRCCNTCDSYEDGRFCLLWGIFCPSDHWCKDWSGNE